MDEKLMEKFKEQFKTELERAFARGVKAGGVMVAKNVIAKLDEHKRNQVAGAFKVRAFCNNVITLVKMEEENEKSAEQNSDDV